MKKQQLRFGIVFALLQVFAFNVKAQSLNGKNFSEDSLAGFDEQIVKIKAKTDHLTEYEYKAFLFKEKRRFINQKYGIANHNDDAIVWKTTATTSVQPGCSNVDFENGTFNGWTVAWGINGNSTTMAGCCPNLSGTVSQVINASGTDPYVPVLSLSSPFGGNKIAKINDDLAGAVVERISQTFSVTSSNAIFQFAYAGVLEDAAHTCASQPFINVSVLDSVGTILACPKIDIVAPSPSCTQPSSNTAGWISSGSVYYHDWEIRTIDLSPYIGTNITIQITVGDCAATAHFGYGYFDCKCSPLEVSSNNGVSSISLDATSNAPINVSTCGGGSVTISAPTGLNPYSWNGPPGSGVSNLTTQSFNSSTAGSYTLVMSPSGSCNGPITKNIVLHTTPNPTVTNITAQATCTNATGSGTVIVASGSYPFSYNWSPPVSTSSITIGLTPGIDYTVNVVDTFGCQNSTILSIASYTDAPTYTINPLSANLSCSSPTILVTAITATNTTAAWTHTTSTDFIATTSGSYTCVLTNTISSCTATVPITIGANTVTPSATFTVNCNSSNMVVLNASSTSGVALGWLVPPIPGSPVSNPGTTSASGVFTLNATNLSSGCKTTYTVQSELPTINVIPTPNTNIITCTNPTIQAMASATPTNASITWINGTSTLTTSSFQFPGQGTYTAVATSTAGCKTQSVITITTNTVAAVIVSSLSNTVSCATGSLNLTASPSTAGAYTYVWVPSNPTNTNSSFTVFDAGTYTLNALNTTNGCTTTATKNIEKETITADFVASSTSGQTPLSVTFTNTSINAVNYSWDFGNGLISNTTGTQSTIYNASGDYLVVLIAQNQTCADTTESIIHVELVIPNVFTPNGDGVNDIFGFEAKNVTDINFTLFDRWGKKIFETTQNGGIKWDGKTKGGAEVSDGTYFYIIKAKGVNDQPYEFKGTINVFR